MPGPPRPLYAMGARMLDMYPVVPLEGGQAVAAPEFVTAPGDPALLARNAAILARLNG